MEECRDDSLAGCSEHAAEVDVRSFVIQDESAGFPTNTKIVPRFLSTGSIEHRKKSSRGTEPVKAKPRRDEPSDSQMMTKNEISGFLSEVHGVYSRNISYARVGQRMLTEVIPEIKESESLTEDEKKTRVGRLKRKFIKEIKYAWFVRNHPNPYLLMIPFNMVLANQDAIEEHINEYRTSFWGFSLGHDAFRKQ